ncbi:Vacuolar protein sorting-associated protein 17 [Xylographa opegraphella]|nr:Vacuolar protein sorting-associated protein 17 [Xylographa opegraphella]
MDYSQLPNDPDHPPGTSPWQTSPRQSRGESFINSVSGSEPPSPIATNPSYQSGAPTPSQEQGSDQGTLVAGSREYLGAEDSEPSEAPTENGSSPDLSTRLQSPPLTEGEFSSQQQQYLQQQQQQQQQRQHSYQQQQRPSRYQSGNRPTQRQNVPQPKLQAKITGLERTGRKDPILRFDVHTNLPRFRTTQFRDVRRTHSEFVKLADHLISANPDAFVPAVPPPVTAAGAGTDEDEARVKSSLQRWLNYVCGNEVLMRDEEMILFVESDFGYSPVVRMKQPATGVRRRVLKQFAPPPDDTPELHEARPVVKLFYLGAMDTGQKVDRVVKARRGLGLAESDLGVKIGQMHVQETHPGLSSAFKKLGRTIQTTGDYHAAQGTAEATTLSDPLAYHSNDAFIVKETLTNRHILLRELVQAQQATRSKLSAADRLKASASVRREKVDEAISALDEAKSHEQHLFQKSQRVTANLLHEKRRWFARTSADLRASIREYVIREIEVERRTLATLESVRPDIRSIDASGGLSRLGRETHPASRRASMAASQGPRGDAWSGVPRRGDQLNRSISGGFGGQALPEETKEQVADAQRPGSSAGSSLGQVKEDDDEDRVDARNAASRLATSTF